MRKSKIAEKFYMVYTEIMKFFLASVMVFLISLTPGTNIFAQEISDSTSTPPALTPFPIPKQIIDRSILLPRVVSLTAFPSSPSPGESVTITAQTPLFNPGEAEFRWVINGRSRPEFSGFGKNKITLEAGPVGTVINAEVIVAHRSRGINNASVTIRVSDLSLIWHAETYVPKWYDGKALPSKSSTVRVAAIPRVIIGGETIPSQRLIFTWDLDSQRNVLSGVGQDIFEFKISNFSSASHRVNLTIEDIDKRIRKEKSVLIKGREPKTAVYRLSPLGGIEFRSAPSSFPVESSGVSDFIVEPFFFPISSKRELVYDWSVAGVRTEGSPENPFILTLDATASPADTLPLSVNVEKPGARLFIQKAVSIFLRDR